MIKVYTIPTQIKYKKCPRREAQVNAFNLFHMNYEESVKPFI